MLTLRLGKASSSSPVSKNEPEQIHDRCLNRPEVFVLLVTSSAKNSLTHTMSGIQSRPQVNQLTHVIDECGIYTESTLFKVKLKESLKIAAYGGKSAQLLLQKS